MSTAQPIDTSACTTAHVHSYKHRVEIEESARCGCFFCFRTFPNTAIKTWIDANQTALCPQCGMDAVIGSASKQRLDDTFLRKMHEHYFPYRKK